MRTVDRLTARAKNILSLIVGIIFTTFLAGVLVPYVGENVAASFAVLLAIGNVALYVGFEESSILATVCGLITSAQVPICATPMTPGCGTIIYLCNKSQITSATFTGSTLVMEAITMTSPFKFYAYEASGTVVNHIEDTTVGKIRTSWKHQVTTVVLTSSGATKAELEALCNGDIVAITVNNYQGTAGDSEYEVHGWAQGLKGSLKRDMADGENQGGYILTLSTPDGRTEPHLPYAFYKTSRVATQNLIALLIA